MSGGMQNCGQLVQVDSTVEGFRRCVSELLCLIHAGGEGSLGQVRGVRRPAEHFHLKGIRDVMGESEHLLLEFMYLGSV